MISHDVALVFVCSLRRSSQSVDADGSTITLASNAGSYTTSVDSSGQMTVEGSDGSKKLFHTQVSKTSGDYSHIRYEPFNPLAGNEGSISKNKVIT